MNFKGDQTLWENHVNYLKFYLNMVFTKVNLAGHTCMQNLEF
jgi:hypothetical protein